MRYQDLKHRLNPPYEYDHKDEVRFIYLYGLFNCAMLKFKDANTVIKIMDDYDSGCLSKDEKKFILERSNKEVLCYVSHGWYGNEPDIFVYGDDNIAFRVDCFV